MRYYGKLERNYTIRKDDSPCLLFIIINTDKCVYCGIKTDRSRTGAKITITRTFYPFLKAY